MSSVRPRPANNVLLKNVSVAVCFSCRTIHPQWIILCVYSSSQPCQNAWCKNISV